MTRAQLEAGRFEGVTTHDAAKRLNVPTPQFGVVADFGKLNPVVGLPPRAFHRATPPRKTLASVSSAADAMTGAVSRPLGGDGVAEVDDALESVGRRRDPDDERMGERERERERRVRRARDRAASGARRSLEGIRARKLARTRASETERAGTC